MQPPKNDFTNITQSSIGSIGESTDTSRSPSIRGTGEIETKTNNIAIEKGIAPASETEGHVIIPPNTSIPPQSSKSGLNPNTSIQTIREQPAKESHVEETITEPEVETSSKPVDEPVASYPKSKADLAVEKIWISAALKFLSEDPKDVQAMVQGRRSEIKASKEAFLSKRNRAVYLERKISKTEMHLVKLERRLQTRKARKGKRAGIIKSSLSPQIYSAKKRLEFFKKEYEDFKTYSPNRTLTDSVENILADGGHLKPVEGGKGGVYFLFNREGQPKFVVKPFDEDMLTINNPKKLAMPFCHEDGIGCPKAGIPVYTGAENEALAGKIAEHLGISRCTVKSEMMVLTSETFHDFTDTALRGSEAEKNELFRLYGEPDKEKLCIVQEFIPGHKEVGLMLLEGATMDQSQFMGLEDEKRKELERSILPESIDQEMFEEAGILALICGEADGNAGNYLIAKNPDPKTGLLSVVKIDNAASFTDDNQFISTGTSWLLKCNEKPLSEKARNFIRNIDSASIAKIMLSRGFRKSAIEAMKDRVMTMKMIEYYLPDKEASFEYYTDYVLTQFIPEEESSPEGVAEAPADEAHTASLEEKPATPTDKKQNST